MLKSRIVLFLVAGIVLGCLCVARGIPAPRRSARDTDSYEDEDEDEDENGDEVDVPLPTRRPSPGGKGGGIGTGAVEYGECSERHDEVLLRDDVLRCGVYRSHVSTVLSFDGRGSPGGCCSEPIRDCNITCVRAQDKVQGSHMLGNITIIEGGIGQNHVKIKFMSAYQHGYNYELIIKGRC